MHFSIITQSFFNSAIRARYDAEGTWPADAFAVDAETVASIRAALLRGDTIETDINGAVIINPKPQESLDTLKLRAASRIEAARNAAIELPITSDAMGAPHTYSAKAENRNFLNNLLTLGIDSKFTCTDAAGVKARRPHTHAQLLALAGDFETHISAQFDNYELKLAEISAASTQADLDAIVW
jgi:hypothetical protein